MKKEDRHTLAMDKWVSIRRSGNCNSWRIEDHRGISDPQIKTRRGNIVVNLSLGTSTPCDDIKALWIMDGDIAKIQIRWKPFHMCIECLGLVESDFKIPKAGIRGVEIINETGVIIKKIDY